MILSVLILLVAGLLAGLIAGLFGLGGGILFAPVLLFMFQAAGIPDPLLWAIATSLFCNVITTASSSFKHYQMDSLFLKEGLLLGFFGVGGTVIGRFIALSPFYSEREFMILFSLVLAYSAFHFLRKKERIRFSYAAPYATLRFHHAFFIGLASGVLATLSGLGGGLIMVPAMSMALSLGFRKTASISSVAIFIITFFGTLQFLFLSPATGGVSEYSIGYVDFGTALPLLAGSVAASRYGVYLLNLISQRILELLFGILMLLVMVRMIYGLM